MEQLVRVKEAFDDGTAVVVHVRESACSGDCHKCSGCGAAKETIVFKADNPIKAQPGDLVYVKTQSAPVLMGAAVVYLVPLLAFFVGYFVLDALWGLGALGGGAAFVVAIGAVVAYDRLIARKQNPVYTIVGYAHRLDT